MPEINDIFIVNKVITGGLIEHIQFTDVEDNDKEYKYKILVYPNITFLKDLEKILMSLFSTSSEN